MFGYKCHPNDSSWCMHLGSGNCWGCQEEHEYNWGGRMFTCGGSLQNRMDDCSPTIQTCPKLNRLHLLWDETHIEYSPNLLTNKGNGTLHHPSLWKERERKKIPFQLFNKSKFIWSTDKEKWRVFFRACTPYDSNLGVLCILARACGLW